jgi:putative inorganic carbon (HCO3(-)) transporter
MKVIKRAAGLLVHIEPLLILAAAPLLLFPSPARSPALLIVPAILIARWIALGRPLEPSPLNASMFLLLLMVLASLWATYDVQQSLGKIAGMVLGVGVFAAVLRSARTASAWAWAWAGLIASGLGVAGIGALGARWLRKFPPLVALTERLPSIALKLPGAESGIHPNEVAGALLWVLPLAIFGILGWLRARRSLPPALRRARYAALGSLLFLSALAMGAVFALTQSRGAWLALALTMLFLGLFWIARRGRRGLMALGITALALAVGAALRWKQIVSLIPLEDAFAYLFGGTQLGEGALSLGTLAGRVEIWSRAIHGLQDFPFTGMGMNTFREVVRVLYLLFTISPEADIGHAHNEFLQAALDLGIPGMIAFIAINLTAFAMLWRLWRAHSHSHSPFAAPACRMVIAGLFASLFSHMLYGLTDAIALGAKPGFLWWWLLGHVASLYRQVWS